MDWIKLIQQPSVLYSSSVVVDIHHEKGEQKGTKREVEREREREREGVRSNPVGVSQCYFTNLFDSFSIILAHPPY